MLPNTLINITIAGVILIAVMSALIVLTSEKIINKVWGLPVILLQWLILIIAVVITIYGRIKIIS